MQLPGPNVSLPDHKINTIREALRNNTSQSTSTSSNKFQIDFDNHNQKDFMNLLKSSASSVSDWENSEINNQLFTEFYEKTENEAYLKMQEFREKLPAFNHKEEILQAIEKHQVVLIEGNTGCGKTTQVVQYILDEALVNLKASRTRILCTQPRRIAGEKKVKIS